MRYILFAGAHYYPGGGFRDFKDSSQSLDDLVAIAIEIKSKDYRLDWWHILDTKTMKVIKKHS